MSPKTPLIFIMSDKRATIFCPLFVVGANLYGLRGRDGSATGSYKGFYWFPRPYPIYDAVTGTHGADKRIVASIPQDATEHYRRAHTPCVRASIVLRSAPRIVFPVCT